MLQLSLFPEPPLARIVPVAAAPQVDGISLFPGVLAAHFEIPGNFSNIANWRARCFFKGTTRKPFSGPMEEVGYVMIHQNGKHIVPIARGDEHHVGYDLMFEFWKKRVRALVPAEFLSFWGLGRNFIYSAEALPPFQRAANTWLSNGGGDSIVTGDYDGMNLTAMISDLVKGEFATGEAALSTETPISKRLCAAFAAVSAGITKYQGVPTAGMPPAPSEPRTLSSPSFRGCPSTCSTWTPTSIWRESSRPSPSAARTMTLCRWRPGCSLLGA
jgi:hypothetical protein